MRLLIILALLVVFTAAAPRFKGITNLVPTGYIRRGYVPLSYLRKNLLQRGLIQLSSREDSSEKRFRLFRPSRLSSSEEKYALYRASRPRSSDEKYQAFRAPNPGSSKCGSDEVLNDFGSCENAHVTRNVYAFTAPKSKYPIIIPGKVPSPEIDLNIVFVKAPHLPDIPRPYVLPPPQQKTVVYVLSENQDLEPQVIEVPSPKSEDPEVYFVNYESGENPELPGGVDLQTALSQMPNTAASESVEDSYYAPSSYEAPPQLSTYGRAAESSYDNSDSGSFITKIAPHKVQKLDSIENY